MSLQKGYDAMPEELRAYPETLGFYGNYHGGANAAIITSDQYFNYVPSQRMPEDDFCSGNNTAGPIFQRLADGTSKSMSFESDNFRHQFHYPRQPLEQVRSGGSPGEREAASFDCHAMYDSEPSSSPSSAVSPEGVAPSTQVPSPLEFAHQPDFVSNKHQHHKHFQTHSPTSSSSPVGIGDEMSVQHLCNMRGQMSAKHDNHHLSQTHRGPKRRAVDTIDAPVTGNRKERRRTQSINTAFAELRDCIPNVPADTKLSKIKTLRLATSYIAYLTEMVSRDDNMNTDMDTMNGLVDTIGSAGALPILRADFAMGTRPVREAIKHESLKNECETSGIKRKRNRTGWPEHVWALELQH